jgi:hypothetical protein
MSMSLSPTAVDAYIPSLLPIINGAIKQWVDMGRLPVLAVVSSGTLKPKPKVTPNPY